MSHYSALNRPHENRVELSPRSAWRRLAGAGRFPGLSRRSRDKSSTAAWDIGSGRDETAKRDAEQGDGTRRANSYVERGAMDQRRGVSLVHIPRSVMSEARTAGDQNWGNGGMRCTGHWPYDKGS